MTQRTQSVLTEGVLSELLSVTTRRSHPSLSFQHDAPNQPSVVEHAIPIYCDTVLNHIHRKTKRSASNNCGNIALCITLKTITGGPN